jgi:hypothetical protein
MNIDTPEAEGVCLQIVEPLLKCHGGRVSLIFQDRYRLLAEFPVGVAEERLEANPPFFVFFEGRASSSSKRAAGMFVSMGCVFE